MNDGRDDDEAAGVALTGFPHAEATGMRVRSGGKGQATVTIPYDERLIGDPDTGVVHGGVITTLLDTGCGVAAMSGAGAAAGVATLDLRIDYMRPARPGLALKAACECYRVTRSVAFARGVAYEESPDDPVATAAGAFMITRANARAGGAK